VKDTADLIKKVIETLPPRYRGWQRMPRLKKQSRSKRKQPYGKNRLKKYHERALQTFAQRVADGIWERMQAPGVFASDDEWNAYEKKKGSE
jgi:hypothetical protein